MKQLLLSALFLLFVWTITAQEQYSRVKLFANRDELASLATKGLIIDNGVFKAGEYIICELSQQELSVAEASGISYEVMIEDVSTYYADRNAPFMNDLDGLKRATYTLSRDWPVPEGFELGPVGGFLTIDQCLEHLDSMAAQYPDLVSPRYAMSEETHNGREMFWVRLSDNATANEDEPEVLYTGMHHAREAIGMQALIYYMYYLLENYETDPDCQYIVDNFELYIVPIINMDGYAYNIQNNPNGGGMWRKNRRQNEDGSYGVDLNRNYGYMWGYDNGGSSPVPSDDTYRGPSATSEPEIQNIQAFCEDHEFRLALNYHSYANQLLYPWGYTPEFCPDDDIFSAFGEILTYENGYEYGPGSTTIYPTNGGSDDWMYGEQTTKEKIFSYTPEVGDGSAGFWPPASMIIPLCQASMWQNMMLAKLAGPWATVRDLAPSILETKTGVLFFDIKRLGLEDGATYTVSIEPLNDAIDSVSDPMTFTDLEILETSSAAFTYFLREDIQSGDAVEYLLTMNNGLISFSDTIRKFFGTPVVVFEDSASTFTKWSSSKWNVTTVQYHSPDRSIADSPTGQYSNYENNVMTLNEAIDLSETVFAVLSFWARWDIETGYDYVQVFVSDNNGSTWTPMEGNYTTPGTENQDPGNPVYDGTQNTWVKEEISLEDYLGKEIKLRFRMKSDSYVVADGMYWDDMEVTVIDIATGIEPTPVETHNYASLQVRFNPNPATGQIGITVIDPKILNNARLMIYDMTGRMVDDRILTGNVKLDISTWRSGMYFFNVLVDQTSVTNGKFIVQ
jgi:hypothetical protein